MSKLITICENTLKYFDNWKVFNQLKESPRIASHSIHGQNVLRRLTAEHLLQKRYFSWRFAILSTISRRFPKKIFRKYNITVVLIVKFRQFNRKWKMMVMFWREIDRMNMCFFLWFCYKSLVSGFSSRFCIVEHRCHQFKVHLLQIKTHRWNANNSHNNRIYLFNWFVVLMCVFFSSFNKVAALLCPTLSLSLSRSSHQIQMQLFALQLRQTKIGNHKLFIVFGFEFGTSVTAARTFHMTPSHTSSSSSTRIITYISLELPGKFRSFVHLFIVVDILPKLLLLSFSLSLSPKLGHI